MSFDDIALPKSTIAEIYRNNLVNIKPKESRKKVKTVVDTAPQSSLHFLGENLKNILILVHYPDVAYLPEQELEFLSKILLACKLDIADIAIINTAKQPANTENTRILNPISVLIFGECVSDILTNKEVDFFITIHQETISILTAPALEKLSLNTKESKQLKSKFWLSLQEFFKL